MSELPPAPLRRRFPRGWDEQRRDQALIGLRMTPAERLRWLEETMATLLRWKGRARQKERGRA